MKKYIYFILIALSFAGCGGGSGNSNNTSNFNQNINKRINITKDYQTETLKNVANANIQLNISSPKDIFVTINSLNNQNIKIDTSYSSQSNKIENFKLLDSNHTLLKEPKKVIEFREKLKYIKKNQKHINSRVLNIQKREVNSGDSQTFYAEIFDSVGNERTTQLQATARKVVKNVYTKQGYKNLVVWVADDEYDNGNITQEMIDKLGNIFLQAGENNDIYDWETNIYGPEWGNDAKNKDNDLISNSNTINILVYDMQIDNMAGFFYAKDNFTRAKEPKSNEKIMFYINSRLYANKPEEVFTTLDHEFQHMINFYQRWVKKDISDPTWFNEMMSETTEDLMATKIKYNGPRNVDYRDGTAGNPGNRGGRYPYFNRYNYYPVNQWFSDIDDYARVSAFGAFLIRNYNGARLLHNLMYSNKTGEDAIVEATGEKDFNTILDKWSQAVILSDKIDLEPGMPQYNFGDFKDTNYNGITYQMGSINFFNYLPKPTFQDENYIYKNGILYYKVGSNLSGKVNINVNMEAGDINIIAK